MRGRVEPLYTCVIRLVTGIYRLDGKAIPESLAHYTNSNDFKNQLLRFADFLFYVNPQMPEDQNVAIPQKKHCRKLKGIMPGKMVMAKDFDETPDCFKRNQ
jgi:hypothetical protein